MRPIGDQFLGFRFDHVLEKVVRQLLMAARGGDHQVVDPSSGIFFWDGLADGEIQLAKVIGVQRPTHGQNHFVVLEEIG